MRPVTGGYHLHQLLLSIGGKMRIGGGGDSLVCSLSMELRVREHFLNFLRYYTSPFLTLMSSLIFMDLTLLLGSQDI